MPIALEYADRVRACAAACANGAAKPRLVSEFEACQRLVANEAVYNSMLATVKAVGLGSVGDTAGVGGPGTEMLPQTAAESERESLPSSDEAGADDCAYHDMSQPVEVIARRLLAHERRLQTTPVLHAEKQRRALQASFIVEFGLEHGLPDKGDVLPLRPRMLIPTLPSGPQLRPERGPARFSLDMTRFERYYTMDSPTSAH